MFKQPKVKKQATSQHAARRTKKIVKKTKKPFKTPYSTQQQITKRHFSSTTIAVREFTPEEIENGHKPVPLQYRLRKAGSGEATRPPLIILHGLLGHANNWSNITAKAALNNDRDIYAVDLRNHGSSPHTEFHSYSAMANDVAKLIEDICVQNPTFKGATVVGHSMGGKVAAAMGILHPHLLTGLALVDILPITYHGSMKEINHILHTVAGCNFANNAGRKEIDQQLAAGGIDNVGIRQWLLTNIISLNQEEKALSQQKGENASMKWKPNVIGLVQNYENIRGFDLRVPENLQFPFHGPSLLILGGISSFGDRDTALDILADHKFPEMELAVIEGAGHWCHSEKPDDFTNKLLGFLDKHNL